MSTDAQFNAAICQEVVWKNAELQKFAVALVRAALAQGGHFTTDIVPDAQRSPANGQPGMGIAGSVVELLKNANVIQPVGHTHAGQWFALRTQSTRPGRKSAWLNVYQLTSPALATAFLQRHGSPAATALKQDEFFRPAEVGEATKGIA